MDIANRGLAALLLGWAGAHLINAVLRLLLGGRRVKLLVVGRYDDGLLRMLYEALYSEQPVAVPLSNRKVYIGYVFDPPGDSPHDHHLALMLLLSGYRQEDSLIFIETVNYADRTILGDSVEDSQIFTITIPMDEVISANAFDRELYEQEFAEKLIIREEGEGFRSHVRQLHRPGSKEH